MKAVVQVFSFDVLAKGFLALATILLIRFMPEQEYATYTLALSLVGLIYQGYIAAFNRLYIVSYHDLSLGEADRGFLGAQLVGIAALAVGAAPFLHGMGIAYVAAVALAMATCFAEYAKVRFQRDLRFFNSSMVEVGRATLFVLLVAGIVALMGMATRASYALLAQALSMLVAFYVVSRRQLHATDFRLRHSIGMLETLLAGEDRNLFLYFVILAVFGQIDIFVLKACSDAKQLASYGSAFRYYTLVSLALGAVHTVLLPSIQQGRASGALRVLIQRQQRLLLMFVPVVLVGAWLSGWFIPRIDLGRYPAAVSVFRLLCLSAIVSFAFSPHANLVISDRAYRFMVGMVVVVLVLGVVLDLLLIPHFGATGAAAGHLLSFGVLNTSFYLRARRSLDTTPAMVLEL